MSDVNLIDRPAADPAPPVSLTERAARRVAEIIAADGRPGLMLRVSVSGGGCSGFQYGFSVDDTKADDDVVVEKDGITMLVDSMSLLYMTGAEVDFVEDLMGAAFKVHNPSATASCGCGTSFSVL